MQIFKSLAALKGTVSPREIFWYVIKGHSLIPKITLKNSKKKFPPKKLILVFFSPSTNLGTRHSSHPELITLTLKNVTSQPYLSQKLTTSQPHFIYCLDNSISCTLSTSCLGYKRPPQLTHGQTGNILLKLYQVLSSSHNYEANWWLTDRQTDRPT